MLLEHEVLRAPSPEVGSLPYHYHFYSKLFDVTAIQASPLTVAPPNERHLMHERYPSAPLFTPLITESSSTVISPKSEDQHGVR
jgi:hypothetical protein